MAISDKTRKRLWAKSGNRCAISRRELVVNPTGGHGDAVVGEECHIRARRPGEARHDPELTEARLDDYDNLILLSSDWHKVIDDLPEAYPAERLIEIKLEHERWVRTTLSLAIHSADGAGPPGTRAPLLLRLTTGSQVLGITVGSHGFDYGNDELSDEEEVELVGDFLQDTQDWADVLTELGSLERTRAEYHLSQQLRELENGGFWVFGGVSRRRIEVKGTSHPWRVTIIRVLRTDNPAIIPLGSVGSAPQEEWR